VRRVRFTSLARLDIVEASDFYKKKSISAEKRFFDDIERTAAVLLEFPGIGEEHRIEIHRFALQDFPYFLYYLILPDGIRVVAVAHQSRHLSHWDDRLR
jgi:plasmid stabilization system protein ParE